MTFMDASVADTTLARKRRIVTAAAVFFAALVATAIYLTWNFPAEHRVNQFFNAIEKQDFPRAYGIWNSDPAWQQHVERYAASGYSYGRFVSDWGTGSDYGIIRTHKILHAASGYGNVTLLAVQVNERKSAPLTLAVTKREHSMNFSPFALTPADTGFGWTDWQISYR